MRDPQKFKDFYQFTFNYAKNPGQKGLDLDMAIAYWNIVLDDKFKFLPLWCQFLQVGYLIHTYIYILYIYISDDAINRKSYLGNTNICDDMDIRQFGYLPIRG